jgi:hypothetical protein
MPVVQRSFLSLSGVQDPSISEFIVHPDLYVEMLVRPYGIHASGTNLCDLYCSRQISTFFLGWTFFCSLRYLIKSPLARRVHQAVCNALLPARKGRVAVSWPQQQTAVFRSDDKRTDNDIASVYSVSDVDYSTLTFTLTLAFMLATIAQFGTLLTFDSDSGGVACGISFPPAAFSETEEVHSFSCRLGRNGFVVRPTHRPAAAKLQA